MHPSRGGRPKRATSSSATPSKNCTSDDVKAKPTAADAEATQHSAGSEELPRRRGRPKRAAASAAAAASDEDISSVGAPSLKRKRTGSSAASSPKSYKKDEDEEYLEDDDSAPRRRRRQKGIWTGPKKLDRTGIRRPVCTVPG